VLRFFLVIVYVAAVSLALLEAALRLFPGAIPFSVLTHFDPALRAGIARRLDLTTKEDMLPVPRDDGGPELWIYPPRYEVYFPHRDIDSVRTVTMDANGFCNPPANTLDKPVIDVIALGDSMVWCTGVNPDKTYPAYLFAETGLAGYNISRPSTGLYEYIQLFKTFGLDKHPGLVILSIYGGNDLRDAERYYATRPQDLTDGDNSGQSRPEPSGWLVQHSYAANVLAGFKHYLPAKKQKRERQAIKDATNFRYTLTQGDKTLAFNPENGDLDEVLFAYQLRQGKIGLDLFERALLNIKSLAEQQGFTALVTYLPSAFAVYWPDVRFEDTELTELMPWFNEQQQHYLANRTRELGLPFVDLTPALRDAAAQYGLDQPLYFPVNRHFTPTGHQVIAEALAETVTSLLEEKSRQSR